MFTSSIAIIGAGFSGTVLALNLLQQCAPTTRIQLLDVARRFGPGLAYGVDDPDLLLNVPAGRMSAFPDQPTHFLDWLCTLPVAETGGHAPDQTSFVPRALYGRYLRHLIATAQKDEQPGRLELVPSGVVALSRKAGHLHLHLDHGHVLETTMAVVATGNNPLAPLPMLDPSTQGSVHRHDPWAENALSDLRATDPILLIGTGLTTVDIVLRLLRKGHSGPIHLLSRRGLLPRAHGTTPPVKVADPHDMPRRLRPLVRFMRQEAERVFANGGSWRSVVDAIRPVTQNLWQGWSDAERRSFLAHVRPWWDVHRHRMAPAVAARIEDIQSRGQMQVYAGRLVDVTVHDGQAEVIWQPRGTEIRSTLHVARVINCTGPTSDITRSPDTLSQSLLRSGLARPDPMRLGLDVTSTGALIAADGRESRQLFGVGPICRGALWEVTAVPDIRQQCLALARHLAGMIDSRRSKDQSDAISVPSRAVRHSVNAATAA